MINTYFGQLPEQQPQISRGANQMPYMMGGGLGGLGAIPMTMAPPPAPTQQPSTGAAFLSAGQALMPKGGQNGTLPPTGNNWINQLVQKWYGNGSNPADPWNTQTIPAGSTHDWLNWAFNR